MVNQYRTCFIDFEFNRVTENPLNLVCCVVKLMHEGRSKRFWLHNNPQGREDLINFLRNIDVVIAYSAIAEARSFISLGIDPLKFKWVDLFLEWRMLTNHNDEMQYGRQYQDGKIFLTMKPKPKWERTETELSSLGGFKPKHSLSECTFKLTGEMIDTAHKTEMRNLIISDPPEFTEKEKQDILDYCHSDVDYLPIIFNKCLIYITSNTDNDFRQTLNEMFNRGRYSALTAIMEARGYPIDVEKTKNFSEYVDIILFETQEEINELFPELKPFQYNRKTGKFSTKTFVLKKFLEDNCDNNRLLKTETGETSISLDAWTRHFPYTHEYPKNSFGAQIVRFLKLKQNLYGFSKVKGKKSFWDYVGSDGRVRPYFNIFGSQSSRSQPSATGYMFLKPAWLRSLVMPAKGKAICGVDYGSQEFFLSALFSEDTNMINSYLSGDVYLAFAKLAGMVPADGTKEKYKRERNLAKSTVLGISYSMTKVGLAAKLTEDSGEKWTEDRAQEMIDKFEAAYPKLMDYKQDLLNHYKEERYLKLSDGWIMFGDNENQRSVCNMPIQGAASAIMRRAVDKIMSQGVYVCKTLHDAIYIEYDIGQESHIDILINAMIEAFAEEFEDEKIKEFAKKIKLDPFAWSPDYKKDSEIITPEGREIAVSDIYIDERAIKEYEQFSKYFYKQDFSSL